MQFRERWSAEPWSRSLREKISKTYEYEWKECLNAEKRCENVTRTSEKCSIAKDGKRICETVTETKEECKHFCLTFNKMYAYEGYDVYTVSYKEDGAMNFGCACRSNYSQMEVGRGAETF